MRLIVYHILRIIVTILIIIWYVLILHVAWDAVVQYIIAESPLFILLILHFLLLLLHSLSDFIIASSIGLLPIQVFLLL